MPLRYIDETRITAIRDLRSGDQVQVEGEIVHAEVQYRPRKALICRLEDPSGQLSLRFLHFYPSQIAALKVGTKLRVFGEVRGGFFGWEMVHPQYRPVREQEPVLETLTPVYPTTAGLTQAALRKWISWALANDPLSETLPTYIYSKLGLPSFADSLNTLHHPAPEANLQAWKIGLPRPGAGCLSMSYWRSSYPCAATMRAAVAWVHLRSSLQNI